MAANLRFPHILVTKSTVPIGTGRWLATVLEDSLPAGSSRELFRIVSNPEFLREGNAVQDFLHPDRVVLGGDDEAALAAVADTYGPILTAIFPKPSTGRRGCPSFSPISPRPRRSSTPPTRSWPPRSASSMRSPVSASASAPT